ncbi:hypothetical protein DPMN_014740 [Dreissena polymorpha]|uniref:Uncharacterized protein n=1 Tax=Dreissena polymorpha TaxID=45954 RepID=A0A9D4S4V8_DREPO|nr:hypothetical protein DPMN_014740 [Dreissena polymorpha]
MLKLEQINKHKPTNRQGKNNMSPTIVMGDIKSSTKTNICVSWPAASAAECALNWKDCKNRAAVMSYFFHQPNLL